MTRVLLIDGESANRLVMHSRLKDAGYEVVVAENGAQGLSIARERTFDLFVVDAHLSGGVGAFEVCRRLKQKPETVNVPVILLSRSASRDDQTKGYEAGCDAFVTKAESSVLDHVMKVLLKYKTQLDQVQHQMRVYEESAKRSLSERERASDIEHSLQSAHSQAHAQNAHATNAHSPHTHAQGAHAPQGVNEQALVWREMSAGRPDGLLIVDGDGIVRHADRGAHDLLGSGLEGKHLGLLTPQTGLEAYVRDTHSDKHEGFRFDVQGRNGRARRALSATVLPIVTRPGEVDPDLRVVLLIDVGRRRVASELLRLQDYTMPRWEVGPLRDAARMHFTTAGLIGTSAAASRLRAQVAEAARMQEPVLILGVTGTGRQHVARTLHYGGESGGPFLALSCAGLSPEHLESELFGHVKGAFPDAYFDRPGFLQHAAHGSVYIEDIEHLPRDLQAKLTRALTEHVITRAGSEKQETVDARVIASTTVDLAARVAAGEFDGELLRALSAIEIELPSLRERREDIPELARNFLRLHGGGRTGLEFSPEALARMESYDWPGNVRELRACIERACKLTTANVIDVERLSTALRDAPLDLPTHEITPAARQARTAAERAGPGTNGAMSANATGANAKGGSLEEWQIGPQDPINLDLYEKKCLLRAIAQSGGNKLDAAHLLEVGKSTLYRKLKKYGIH